MSCLLMAWRVRGGRGGGAEDEGHVRETHDLGEGAHA